MKYSRGHGWEKKILILFEIPKINDYLNIALSLLYVIMFVIVFYYFYVPVVVVVVVVVVVASLQLQLQLQLQLAQDTVGGSEANEFASDLVSGVNMAAVTANPNAIIDKAKNIASAIIKAKTGDKKGAVDDATKDSSPNKKRERGASDKMFTGGEGASDKMSTGGGSGASDSVSTGGVCAQGWLMDKSKLVMIGILTLVAILLCIVLWIAAIIGGMDLADGCLYRYNFAGDGSVSSSDKLTNTVVLKANANYSVLSSETTGCFADEATQLVLIQVLMVSG